MRAVFNTSPLCYLAWIGEIDVLPELFDEVLAPEAVLDELSHPATPRQVREWALHPPSWLRRHSVDIGEQPDLDFLHEGETAAIVLARVVDADWVVLDEKEARRVAVESGLAVIGLLGVLDLAATKGLFNLPNVVDALRETSFYVSPKLLKRLLDKHQG